MTKLENNIGWCDVSGNPGIGCRGCELGHDCYAEHDTPARVLRSGNWPGFIGQKIETFGKDRIFVPTKKGLQMLSRLNELCICEKCRVAVPFDRLDGERCPVACDGKLRRIRAFCDSNSDWMDWPIDVLARSLDQIRRAPNVDVILLTKWPELWSDRLHQAMRGIHNETDAWISGWLDGFAPENVIVMTSVLGNALDAKRIKAVLEIPAHRRGLSCEPLWGEPDLLIEDNCSGWCCPECGSFNIDPEAFTPANDLGQFLCLDCKHVGDPGADPLWKPRIQWLIVGCDSSKHRKGWENYDANARSVIEQARTAGMKVWHKQMPSNGKVSLDPKQFPADMQIREFPSL